MPLGPLRIACVQPAPKSRFVVSDLTRYEKQIKSEARFALVSSLNSHWPNIKPVGVSLLTNAVCHSTLMCLIHRCRQPADFPRFRQKHTATAAEA
jgi:hypothetical protein